MSVPLKVIVAVSENMGIGNKGDLPWKLRKEMAFFTRMTTTTKDPNKKNVVIMGKNTWDSIPTKYKPLPKRINFVLSRTPLNLSQYKDTYGFSSMQQAYDKLLSPSFQPLYEDVWICGGASLYKESMQSPNFYRLYLTRIHKTVECDTFLTGIPENVKEVSDPLVSTELQKEEGLTYKFHVYERA